MFNPNAPDNGGERELLPRGTHAARCVRIIELGKQYSKQFDSESNKAVIVLALPNVTVTVGGEEKQAFISNPFGITLSTGDKSTMKQYTRALDPDGTAKNLGDLLNRTCQVYIEHQTKGEKTYARIHSVAPLLPGLQVPELDTEPFWFRWDKPDPEAWKKIPEFQQELVKEATNYPDSKVEQMVLGFTGGVAM
jgi:hypothetical protein